MHRKIIHIDMDAFYASVEQRDFPEYRGKPLIVGGPPEGRGVVATASYEARKFGVRSAMPSRKARELCPHALFVAPRFEVYKQVSHRIREIFRRYTPLIEPLSLDEAYLDVTEDTQGIGSAIEIAGLIRKAIREELQLTASAGISVNKFVAKIASDMNKPDGMTFIGPSRIESFMEQLPVEKFFGVGKVTASKMRQMGLYTGMDLKKLSEADLVGHFGKAGHFFYKIVRGIDERVVKPSREIKSISVEDTFRHDVEEFGILLEELLQQAERLSERLEKRQLKGKTLTLKVKFSDFKQITRSRTLPQAVADPETVKRVGTKLLEGLQLEGRPVRLLGLGISNFHRPVIPSQSEALPGQLRLF